MSWKIGSKSLKLLLKLKSNAVGEVWCAEAQTPLSPIHYGDVRGEAAPRTGETKIRTRFHLCRKM